MKGGLRVGGVFEVDNFGMPARVKELHQIIQATMAPNNPLRVQFERWRRNQYLKWQAVAKNTVVNEGLDYILQALFESDTSAFGTVINPWYIGLLDSTPTVGADDVLGASSNSWSEVTAYSEANRQEFVEDGIASQSEDNSNNKGTFTINSDNTTIGGAMLVESNTKGGTGGILLCGAAFSAGDKTADDGDTLEVQYTFSAADDGA
jgi:hypothetical protein